jgi:threonine/homoserine/homoserine lactone efflux protein
MNCNPFDKVGVIKRSAPSVGVLMSIDFLLTAFVVVLIPGTGVMYTLAVGLGQGSRAASVAALGCTLGILPQLLASIFGLAAILHASETAFQVIKVLGVLYLLWMAWQALRDDGLLSFEEDRTSERAGSLIGTGILLNLLNPKLSMFFVAFLPQFVPIDANNAEAIFLALGLVFMVMTFVVFVGYGFVAAHVRYYFDARPQAMVWLRWAFAATFLLLGLRLAFTSI